MKKFAALAIIFVTMLSINLFSQQQQQPEKIIKPTIYAGDVVFVFNLLNTVELTGREVDAFILVRNSLKPYIEKIKNEKMQATTNVNLDIPINTAQALLTFMDRGKIAGADADTYKRVVDALVAAAKNAK